MDIARIMPWSLADMLRPKKVSFILMKATLYVCGMIAVCFVRSSLLSFVFIFGTF